MRVSRLLAVLLLATGAAASRTGLQAPAVASSTVARTRSGTADCYVEAAPSPVSSTLPGGVWGQGRDRRPDPAARRYAEQTRRFVFTRIRYGGYRSTWNHDYPRADLNLPRILDDITTIDVHLGESNVFWLDDPELFKHPIAYISEPGFWSMSESEVRGFRNYLLKGGFVIFDDFEAEQWDNFTLQVRRALPDHRLIEIDVTHPIFQVFFGMQKLDFPHPLVRVEPSYWGIFEENDPTGRMMAIVNYNNDIAEYWEWSAEGFFPVDFTNDAYKLGVNYIVYGLTH